MHGLGYAYFPPASWSVVHPASFSLSGEIPFSAFLVVWSSQASDSSFSLVLAVFRDREAAALCFYSVPLLLQHALRSTWSRRLKRHMEAGLGPLKEAHKEWRDFTWSSSSSLLTFPTDLGGFPIYFLFD